MFELLLQADRALADGALDQAERTYWQLIELDPKNAIALAGLARVALERGDEKAARKYADRALGLDPDSFAARRVLDSLAHAGSNPAGDDLMAAPMLAAERLEALSRRRGTEAGATTHVEPAADAASELDAEPGEPAQKKVSGAARHAAAKTAGPETVEVIGKAGRDSRGRTSPDQIGALPAEPLRERRKAGRLAAAAAAAAAAAREPVRTRHEPHHAMPIGRRYFEPSDLAPGSDAGFSEAEMAAAVEAVDAVDEPALAPSPTSHSKPAAERDAGSLEELLGAVEATGPDESVALRLAVVSETLERETAELDAAGLDVEAEEAFEEADAFEAAEAMAASGLNAGPIGTGPRPTYLVGIGDDLDAASAAADTAADDTAEADAAEADAAEAAAAAEAMHQVSSADSDVAMARSSPRSRSQLETADELTDGPSEQEAEAQALHEALSQVLSGEGAAGSPKGPPDAGVASSASAEATREPAGDAASDGDAGPQAQTEAPGVEATTEPKRRRGILGRIRGG